MGYQKGGTNGFSIYNILISGPYVNGVSITYGNPRKHICTYTIGQSGQGNNNDNNCPCASFPGSLPPSFVHENYYNCECGAMFNADGYFTDDPVWDGEGCSSDNSCCSEPNLVLLPDTIDC